MNEFALWISVVGLACDVFGVGFLFFYRDKGLSELKWLHRRELSSASYGESDKDFAKRKFNELGKDVNKLINTANDNNHKIYRKSIKWLVLILLGFSLQIVGLFLGYAAQGQNQDQYQVEPTQQQNEPKQTQAEALEAKDTIIYKDTISSM